MEISVKLYSPKCSNVKTYLLALLLVAGNTAPPQLCYLVPHGGPTLLPIYFLTLIAAYKYGSLVGLLTAILSLVINYLLFAIPSEAVPPILLIKSSLLAGASALAARTIKSVSSPAILGVVFTYQVIGVAFEWVIAGSFYEAAQDFRIGILGMLLRWFGGYALLKAIAKL